MHFPYETLTSQLHLLDVFDDHIIKSLQYAYTVYFVSLLCFTLLNDSIIKKATDNYILVLNL